MAGFHADGTPYASISARFGDKGTYLYRPHLSSLHDFGRTVDPPTGAGVREILECWFEDRPIREECLIVSGGELAGAGAHSYSAGNATGGSDEAARYRK